MKIKSLKHLGTLYFTLAFVCLSANAGTQFSDVITGKVVLVTRSIPLSFDTVKAELDKLSATLKPIGSTREPNWNDNYNYLRIKINISTPGTKFYKVWEPTSASPSVYKEGSLDTKGSSYCKGELSTTSLTPTEHEIQMEFRTYGKYIGHYSGFNNHGWTTFDDRDIATYDERLDCIKKALSAFGSSYTVSFFAVKKRNP
jgi:hypothetical protein